MSPDDTTLATASFDRTVRLWHAPSGRALHVLEGHEDRLFAVHFSPDGKWVASAGQGPMLNLWDSSSGELRKTLRHKAGIAYALVFSPDGRQLVVGGAMGGADQGRYVVATTRGVWVFDGSGRGLSNRAAGAGATAVALSGAYLLAGFGDGNLERWSTAAAAPQPSFSFQDVPASAPERILPGPLETIIVGYADGVLGIWHRDTGARLAHGRLYGPVRYLLLTAHRLYAATELGDHLVWDLGVLYSDYCALLRHVWAQVPTVWEAGGAVARPSPAAHRCVQR